jgi:hypothetical protein
VTLFVERRRPAFTPELLLRVALAWAMIAALLLVTNLGAILAYRFPDPDDTLRLVQVRDLLAGQGWFDLTQHRVDAVNGGVPMHWSRLVDLPIAAVVLMLRGPLGQHGAETVALIVVPLITFGAALLLAGRIAWRLLGDEAASFACLAMALLVPLIQQLRPMRIDHHGWQIVCALAAVNGLMARTPRRGGWITGIALAGWLVISIEGLPLVAVFCGIAALRWLRDRHEAGWLTGLLQGLAAGSTLLFLATRGLPTGVTHCDAIGPAHLLAFGAAAVGVTVLARLEPLPRFAQIAGIAISGGFAAATLLSAAPQCAGGAFAEIDPLVARFWYQGVSEGLPVWRQDPALALQIVIPPLIGILACLQLAGRSSGWLRNWWHDYTVLLLGSLAIALFVARAGAVAGAIAAVPLGWQIREWLRSARTLRRPGRRALAFAAMVLALAPAMPLTLLAIAIPAHAAAAGNSASPRVSSCSISDGAKVFGRLPRGEIMAPLDIGPQLLFETADTVVATGHHRGQRAMRVVIETFTGTPDHARAVLVERGTRYVAICPDLAEPGNYRAAAPSGLMASLLARRAPAWLEPVATAPDGSLQIWRVRG